METWPGLLGLTHLCETFQSPQAMLANLFITKMVQMMEPQTPRYQSLHSANPQTSTSVMETITDSFGE
jgi:hypothetical protein